MNRYLYEVRLDGAASKMNKSRFFANVTDIGAIATDHAGISVLCALSSVRDAAGVKELCTKGFRPKAEAHRVTVVEITAATVADPSHAHSAYQNVVDFFYQYGAYPNIP
ncbi:hypothetical protein [Janthinobacterium sp. PSPC3-1]|uniref:hypothetical protein n=1 Tax=Janthinobacterium sp. PSPC3-1 TaxID=2804653 RepID=UPI003CEDCE81